MKLQEQNMGFMVGKRALIVGLASKRSIAWGIAQALSREGAELAFTHQNDKLRPRVEKMAEELGSNMVYPLDVTFDAEIDDLFKVLGKEWDGLEVLVHSVGSLAVTLRASRVRAFKSLMTSLVTVLLHWRSLRYQ
jgi:enoyl-[acyl-carrier-protein] reductase (NADH)